MQEVSADCGTIAAAFLLDGPKPGMYSRVAAKAGLEEAVLSGVVEGLAKIFIDSVRVKASDTDVKGGLVEHAGFSDDAAASIGDAFKARREELSGFIPGAVH